MATTQDNEYDDNFPMLFRSFDPEFLMDHFKKTDPTVSERAEVFFKLWKSWEPNAYEMGLHKTLAPFHKMLDNMGLKHMRDYQMRGGEIRFSSKEYLAMALAAGLAEIAENRQV